MKIMTTIQYNAIVDIISDQQKRIEEKESEIKYLKNQIQNLQRILDYSNIKQISIDFPNSQKGGFEDINSIFLM